MSLSDFTVPEHRLKVVYMINEVRHVKLGKLCKSTTSSNNHDISPCMNAWMISIKWQTINECNKKHDCLSASHSIHFASRRSATSDCILQIVCKALTIFYTV
jgi:hypothetical protein